MPRLRPAGDAGRGDLAALEWAVRTGQPMTPANGVVGGFGVAVDLGGTRAVLTVRGEVDLASAPELGAILHTVINEGHRSVLLDLAALDFMDAAGLRVISGGAARLALSDGGLTIRSPSPTVRLILDIVGLGDLYRAEQPDPARV